MVEDFEGDSLFIENYEENRAILTNTVAFNCTSQAKCLNQPATILN